MNVARALGAGGDRRRRPGGARYNFVMAKRTPPPPRDPQLELAGEPCVAFLNTAGARPDNRQLGVSSFDELVTWCLAAGTVSASEAERLRRRAAERPAKAEAVFALAAKLRTSLAHGFLAAQRQEPGAETHLEPFNLALAESSLEPRLVEAKTGITWAWVGDPEALDNLLAPILNSALKVVIGAEGRPVVRQCIAPGCRLFFVDRSPTGHRRWCAMNGCGNRAKTKSYYRRVLKAERKQRRKDAIPKPRRRS